MRRSPMPNGRVVVSFVREIGVSDVSEMRLYLA